MFVLAVFNLLAEQGRSYIWVNTAAGGSHCWQSKPVNWILRTNHEKPVPSWQRTLCRGLSCVFLETQTIFVNRALNTHSERGVSEQEV